MKIVFFTYDFPFPPNSGGKMRAFNLIKYAREDTEIILFSFIRKNFDQKYLKDIYNLGVKQIKIFPRKPLNTLSSISSVLDPVNSIFKKLYFDEKIYLDLEKIVIQEKIDLIHFESFYTAFYLDQRLKNLGVKILLGEENIEYEIYKDYVKKIAPILLKPVYLLESIKIKKEEELLWKRSDKCIAVIQEEAELIEKISKKKCFVVPNGVDLAYFKFRERTKTGGNILFVGNFSYYPNIDAINHFYNQVFKDFKNSTFKLTIIGKGSSKLSIKDSRVNCIEFVEDIREEYYKADIFIFPVRFGGGTNFKILEAMATGLPIVAYPDRVHGLDLENGKHVLIAGNTIEFTKCINNLATNVETVKTLAKNSRQLVEEKYSWISIGRKLNKIWREL